MHCTVGNDGNSECYSNKIGEVMMTIICLTFTENGFSVLKFKAINHQCWGIIN